MDEFLNYERYGADGVLIDLLFVLDPDSKNEISKALTRPENESQAGEKSFVNYLTNKNSGAWLERLTRARVDRASRT